MSLEQTTRWRSITGKAAALLCALMVLTLLDGLFSRFKHDPQLVEMLPGESADVNGGLKEDVAGIEELEYASSSEAVTLSFQAVHSGFWLGGLMWRGKVRASSSAPAGEYRLSVAKKGGLEGKLSTVFRIKVYSDGQSRQQSSPSFLVRHFGVSPWLASGVILPGALLCFGLVYLLSMKRDALLAQEGKAEIYHIVQSADGYEFAFGFGSSHGVKPGALLPLLDEEGRQIGSVEVKKVMETDSTASVGADFRPKPGYMVLLLDRGAAASGGFKHGA